MTPHPKTLLAARYTTELEAAIDCTRSLAQREFSRAFVKYGVERMTVAVCRRCIARALRGCLATVRRNGQRKS